MPAKVRVRAGQAVKVKLLPVPHRTSFWRCPWPLWDSRCRGEAPLAFQRLALRGLRKPGPLDRQTGETRTAQEDVVGVVGDLAHCGLIDHRGIDPGMLQVSSEPPTAAAPCKSRGDPVETA
jgi:hypothetical protein